MCQGVGALPGAFWLAQIGNIELAAMVKSLMLVACTFVFPCMAGGVIARVVSPKSGHLFVLGAGYFGLFWVHVYV